MYFPLIITSWAGDAKMKVLMGPKAALGGLVYGDYDWRFVDPNAEFKLIAKHLTLRCLMCIKCGSYRQRRKIFGKYFSQILSIDTISTILIWWYVCGWRITWPRHVTSYGVWLSYWHWWWVTSAQSWLSRCMHFISSNRYMSSSNDE